MKQDRTLTVLPPPTRHVLAPKQFNGGGRERISEEDEGQVWDRKQEESVNGNTMAALMESKAKAEP